jgi:hypothetical protein
LKALPRKNLRFSYAIVKRKLHANPNLQNFFYRILLTYNENSLRDRPRDGDDYQAEPGSYLTTDHI